MGGYIDDSEGHRVRVVRTFGKAGGTGGAARVVRAGADRWRCGFATAETSLRTPAVLRVWRKYFRR
jgi:hypothetical protein